MLETCLLECKRKLDYFRRVGDSLQADMTRADMDRMLDELQRIYRTLKGKPDANSHA